MRSAQSHYTTRTATCIVGSTKLNGETSVGIEPTTSGLDLPLLCRLSYEVGQRKSDVHVLRGTDIHKLKVDNS